MDAGCTRAWVHSLRTLRAFQFTIMCAIFRSRYQRNVEKLRREEKNRTSPQIPHPSQQFRLLGYFKQPRGLFVDIRKIVEHVKDLFELPEVVIRP
jgi:hypothetical protein